MDRSLLILAGGRGTRLGGTRKPSLVVGGRPILRRIVDALGPLVDEILALTQPGEAPVAGARVVADPQPHAGVPAALAHGLRAARGDVCLIVGGDMPFVQATTFSFLLDIQRVEHATAVIPRVEGYLQPLHAVVDRRRALDALEAARAAGEQRLFRALEQVSPRIVDAAELWSVDPDLRSLFNINTPADLATAERLAAEYDPHS